MKSREGEKKKLEERTEVGSPHILADPYLSRLYFRDCSPKFKDNQRKPLRDVDITVHLGRWLLLFQPHDPDLSTSYMQNENKESSDVRGPDGEPDRAVSRAHLLVPPLCFHLNNKCKSRRVATCKLETNTAQIDTTG